MEIQVVENVLKLNDEVAALNRAMLREAGVRCIDLIGSPGCGKTALLEQTLQSLAGDLEIGVLTGDLATTRDARRIARSCRFVSQINTGNGCHLDANQVRQGMKTFPLEALDLLIIENVGNLICPVGFDLGQDFMVGMFSVTEGDDKPAKHPRLVLTADLLLLNKIDLLPYVAFDLDTFRSDIAAQREDVPILELSVTGHQGIDDWLGWLRTRAETPAQPAAASAP